MKTEGIQFVRCEEITQCGFEGGDIPLTGQHHKNKSLFYIRIGQQLNVRSLLPSALPVCPLSCRFNSTVLRSGRNTSYWERPEPNTTGRPLPIESGQNHSCRSQKPIDLQWDEKSNVCELAGLCVWPQSLSLFNTAWEWVGGTAFFLRVDTEALQKTDFSYVVFISETTCWKWCLVITILTLPSLIYLTGIHVTLGCQQKEGTFKH